MKKFGILLMLLSLGLFTVGCAEPKPVGPDAGTTPEAGTETETETETGTAPATEGEMPEESADPLDAEAPVDSALPDATDEEPALEGEEQ